GPQLASNQTAPLVGVATRAFGSAGGALLAIAAAVSTFGYVSCYILTTPRILFAFGRDGFLPARFGSVHPRNHTPALAIIAHAAACVAFALTGTFTSLVVLSTVSMLLIYFATCLAAIQLRRRDVRTDGPPFVLRGGPVIPLLACVVVVWMLSSASRIEFISVGVALVIATVLYAIRQYLAGRPVVATSVANLDVAEREYAVVISLNSNVSGPRKSVVRPRRELARLDLGFPVGALQIVLEQLLAVHPVLHMITLHDDKTRIPLVCRLHDTGWRRIYSIRRSSGRQTTLSVGMTRIVE